MNDTCAPTLGDACRQHLIYAMTRGVSTMTSASMIYSAFMPSKLDALQRLSLLNIHHINASDISSSVMLAFKLELGESPWGPDPLVGAQG